MTQFKRKQFFVYDDDLDRIDIITLQGSEMSNDLDLMEYDNYFEIFDKTKSKLLKAIKKLK